MAATCPLGYGTGGAKSSPMECKRCRGLLFETQVALPCRCAYCGDCIEGIKDCFGCGADVEGREKSEEFDKHVQIFVKAHTPKNAHEKGMFWLEHAVKHEKMGNMFAANARYVHAMESFRDDPDSNEEMAICMSKQAEISWRYLSDNESARELFKVATNILSQKESVKNVSLGVTCMKWAMFEHTSGNVEKSLELFQNALNTRLDAQSQGACSDEDVAAAYLGIAGSEKDLGHKQEAERAYKQVIALLPESKDVSERSLAMREQATKGLLGE